MVLPPQFAWKFGLSLTAPSWPRRIVLLPFLVGGSKHQPGVRSKPWNACQGLILAGMRSEQFPWKCWRAEHGCDVTQSLFISLKDPKPCCPMAHHHKGKLASLPLAEPAFPSSLPTSLPSTLLATFSLPSLPTFLTHHHHHHLGVMPNPWVIWVISPQINPSGGMMWAWFIRALLSVSFRTQMEF